MSFAPRFTQPLQLKFQNLIPARLTLSANVTTKRPGSVAFILPLLAIHIFLLAASDACVPSSFMPAPLTAYTAVRSVLPTVLAQAESVEGSISEYASPCAVPLASARSDARKVAKIAPLRLCEDSELNVDRALSGCFCFMAFAPSVSLRFWRYLPLR